MFIKISALYFSLLCIISIGCQLDGAKKLLSELDDHNTELDSTYYLSHSDTSEYNFSYPDYTFVLDKELIEISGLTYVHNKNRLLAVGDEIGYYYEIGINDGVIKNKHKFNGHGDYEALEYVGSDVIVVKSSGNIYIKSPNDKESKVIKTELSRKNNVEGMAYLPTDSTLLIACKGNPYIDKKNDKDIKTIYSFSLSDGKLNTKPYLVIDIKYLKSYMEENLKAKYQNVKKKVKNRIEDFSPSGIAIHPTTKDIYIISARGSSLIVYDNNGKLQDIVMLNSITIPQPEGIAFDRDHNLYISTEGQGNSGKIFKFLSQ